MACVGCAKRRAAIVAAAGEAGKTFVAKVETARRAADAILQRPDVAAMAARMTWIRKGGRR